VRDGFKVMRILLEALTCFFATLALRRALIMFMGEVGVLIAMKGATTASQAFTIIP
jgi:hypothetical protein